MISLLFFFWGVSASFFIEDVPYNHQITDYSCAEGVLETIFDFWGPDVLQEGIINIARATSSIGTYSWDMVRAGHFSHLSGSAISTQIPFFPYPTHIWTHGVPGRSLGLASFVTRSSNCWFDQLVDVLRSTKTPVLLLMWYNSLKQDDGHYRAAVSYDSSIDSISLYDPWDSFDGDGQPRLVSYGRHEFCDLWSLTENSWDRVYPGYVGIFLSPWRIYAHHRLNTKGNVSVFAEIQYPCPAPFCNRNTTTQHDYKAQDAHVILHYASSRFRMVEGSSDISLGTMLAGQIVRVTWILQPLDITDPLTPAESFFVVEAFGTIQGSVPRIQGWFNNTWYPSYSYSDRIGGSYKLYYRFNP